jgi:hypothetical protein
MIMRTLGSRLSRTWKESDMLSRTLRSLALAAAIAASLAGAALAQTSPVATQQSATHQDAVGLVATSATSAATLTLGPVGPNQSVYVTNIEITNCAGASAVTAAAPTTITTTNLGGASWTVGSGTTAGACQPSPAQLGGAFIKSAPQGASATVVLPTFATNQTVRVSVYYYIAP